jgi:hypothetical protein
LSEFSVDIIQDVPASRTTASGTSSPNEINDGHSLVCIECQRSMRALSFETGLVADFAELFSVNSKRFINLSSRKRHATFDLCEIIKEWD